MILQNGGPSKGIEIVDIESYLPVPGVIIKAGLTLLFCYGQ